MISLSELEANISEAETGDENLKRDITLLETETENIETEANSTIESNKTITERIKDAQVRISKLEKTIHQSREDLIMSRERVSEFQSKMEKAVMCLK